MEYRHKSGDWVLNYAAHDAAYLGLILHKTQAGRFALGRCSALDACRSWFKTLSEATQNKFRVCFYAWREERRGSKKNDAARRIGPCHCGFNRIARSVILVVRRGQLAVRPRGRQDYQDDQDNQD